MAQSNFTHTHRVSYAECAPGDHVYFSRYLEMIEECRGELHRSIGLPLKLLAEREGVQFPVRECRVRYHGAARHDDLLRIEVGVLSIKRARITLAYRVCRDEELLVSAEIEHVCTAADAKPRPFPAELLERLSAFRPDM